MFTSLSNKISSFISNIKNQNNITDKNILDLLKKIQESFIEADVDIKVTENFIDEIKNKIFQKK